MTDLERGKILEFSTARRGSASSAAHIIAVGGGKGGVGKSFVSSNIAIFLAKLGYKTTIVDLDLGAANTHTSLGEGLPHKGLGDFLKCEGKELVDYAVNTSFKNLSLISGCNDGLDIANIDIINKSRLMSSIYKIPGDFVILDLSAGTHKTTIDFFSSAQTQLIVFTPEPSSIENAYRFIKTTFYRKVKRFEKQLGLGDLISSLMSDRAHNGIKTPSDLMNAIMKNEPQKGIELQRIIEAINFNFVINQTRTSGDINIGHSIQSVCNKFFGISGQFIGHVEHDNAVWQSLRNRRPLLLEQPQSRLYSQLLQISKSIAYTEIKKEVV